MIREVRRGQDKVARGAVGVGSVDSSRLYGLRSLGNARYIPRQLIKTMKNNRVMCERIACL